MKKRWILKNLPADFKELGRKLGVSPVVVRCIRNRGPETEEEMRSYLYAGMDELHDPMLMLGIPEAVDLITGQMIRENNVSDRAEVASAVKEDSLPRIAIASDYDCDGICSGMILKKGLERIGFETKIYTPDRVSEGYGLNKRIIDDAVADGCGILITCDNGIAANDAVSYSKEKELTVIITDHHEPQEELPEADVIIDPKAEEKMIAEMVRNNEASVDENDPSRPRPYPFEGLCGAGVAYKLIEALYKGIMKKSRDMNIDFSMQEALTIGDDLLELAAIATITDVMELVDENRIIVKYGLQALRHTENKGLRNLLRQLRLEDVPLKGSDIGFRIGPTLNATGRIADVDDAFALLNEKDEDKAKKLAEKLVALNDQRKTMTENGTKTALDTLYRDFPDADKGVMEDVPVLYVPGLHESIVGLIAGKIKERFNHPVIAFTDGAPDDRTGEKMLKGSGRSIKNYHMFDHLMEVKSLTTAFGGHAMAAGLTIPEANLDELRTRLNENSGLTADDFVPDLMIDLEVPLSYLSEKLIDEIDKMGPFGVANPRPIFAVRSLRIDRVQYMGKEKQHLKLFVKEESGTMLEAVAFSRAEEFDNDVITAFSDAELELIRRGKSDKFITVAYQPQINEYNGFRSIQLNLIEWNFQ